MKTLEKQLSTYDQEAKLPNEVIEEILTRLPMKSILRFKSVSKPWLSLINNPSFTKLHFTRVSARCTTLIISAFEPLTCKRHFYSTAYDGGPITHLMALPDDFTMKESAEVEHLNGLVLYTSANGADYRNQSFVINPSTRKIYKLVNPYDPALRIDHLTNVFYFFGFDESRSEHKILNIRMLDIYEIYSEIDAGKFFYTPTAIEFMMFSMSNYTWRKIDVDLPLDIRGDDTRFAKKTSVCVNSVIHLMLYNQNVILAFDLTTEKCSIINLPYELGRDGRVKTPDLVKINGLLGVVCHYDVLEINELHLWILQDYKNRVWVKKTIPLYQRWRPLLQEGVNTDEVVFIKRGSKSRRLTIPIYNMKNRRLKSIRFTHGQFQNVGALVFHQVRSYVESITPLEGNQTWTS